MFPGDTAAGAKWVNVPTHRQWLMDQATRLFAFYEPHVINADGGFHDLGDDGKPLLLDDGIGGRPPRAVYSTARFVYCFSIARLLGRPGAERIIDHGMDYLWNGLRDPVHGGYVWSTTDDSKQAYGHAFVLLAASAAKVVGHPDADRLLADVSDVLISRYWDAKAGASREEFARDWSPIGPYRGQNANMHLTEACMAAFEATGDRAWLDKAESIATLLVHRHAAALGGRLPEHFTEDWQLDRDYAGNETFRPYGFTPGHWLEWVRLLLQLWETGGRRLAWIPDAARVLFANATAHGWDEKRGGFYYTLDWDNRPRVRCRLFWPAAEGIGAATFLNAIDGAAVYEAWYRRIWDFVAGQLIDLERGGWRAEAFDPAEDAKPFFAGKPDLYHDLQACLIPLVPATGSIMRGLAQAQATAG